VTSTGSTGNVLINENYGGLGANSTADIQFDANAHKLRLYNTTLASSTEVSGVTTTNAYVVSFKHDGTAGSTKIWNDYAFATNSAETPQDETTNKFNYADNLWENSFTPHSYNVGSGAGTEDTNLDYGINGTFGGDNSVYNYRILCTASNCVTTPNSWAVYRNGTLLTNYASTGSTYTDTQNDGGSAPNIQFKIDDAGTDYTAGATYTFTAWKASGDTNTTKTVTLMQDGDTYTIGSGQTLQSIGDATHRTSWTRGGASGGYNIINQGTLNMQYSDINYLKGANGIDFQSGSSLTSLSNTTFDNLVSTGSSDAFIKVLASVIDAGGNKTLNGNTFNNTGSGAEYNLFRSGTSTGSGYTWHFTNPSGALSGEDYDYEPDGTPTDPPGMITWPNPPTNDSLTFTNPYTSNVAVADNTTEWIFEAKVTDAEGPTNIDYVEMRFANATDNTQPYDSLKYRWTESTDTFSEQADTQDCGTITSTADDSNASGNQWTLDFKIKIDNDFLAKDTNYAIELYTVDDAAASDNDNYADKYQVTALSLSLSVDSGTINFGNLTPGTPLVDTTVTTVTTNYPNGYVLQIHDGVSGSNSALKHSDLVTYIADYLGTIETPTLWSGTGLGICVYAATNKESKWGTGTTESDPNNKYAGIPETATTIHTKPGSPTSGDNTSIGYKLDVPNTQKSGSYSGDVTYTATGVLE